MNACDFLKIAFYPFGKAAGIQPFLIVILSRTGSNLLASNLDSHPEILCHHEVFRMDSIHMASTVKSGKRKMDLAIFEGRDREPFAFLRRVYATRAESLDGQLCATKAIGIKFSHYQGKWILLALLLNRQIKKVVVRRENILAAFMSGESAWRSSRWVEFADRDYSEQKTGPDKIPLQLHRYFPFVRKVDWFYRLLAIIFSVTAQRVASIEYKEITQGDKIPDVLAFLGVDQNVPLQAATSRQAKRRLVDRIANIEEVRGAFAGRSRHERWLREK
jgi:hypothetical protein